MPGVLAKTSFQIIGVLSLLRVAGTVTGHRAPDPRSGPRVCDPQRSESEITFGNRDSV